MFLERATEHAASDLCRALTSLVRDIHTGAVAVDIKEWPSGAKRIRLVKAER